MSDNPSAFMVTPSIICLVSIMFFPASHCGLGCADTSFSRDALTPTTMQSPGDRCSRSSTAPKLAPHLLHPLLHSRRSSSPDHHQPSVYSGSHAPFRSLYHPSHPHRVPSSASNYAAVYLDDRVSHGLVHPDADVADCTAKCAAWLRFPVV